MSCRKRTKLIVIENGRLTDYSLDEKTKWEIGRAAKDNIPDIRLTTATVSRKHGCFMNMNGVWFYTDYNSKNGTVYNKKRISPGIKGRVKPMLLADGDILVYGGGDKETINCRTVWSVFLTKAFDDSWRIIDSKGYNRISLISDNKETILENPVKGTVIEKESGIAIYMGDLTYIIGDMEMTQG